MMCLLPFPIAVIPAQAGIQTRYRCGSITGVSGSGFPPARE